MTHPRTTDTAKTQLERTSPLAPRQHAATALKNPFKLPRYASPRPFGPHALHLSLIFSHLCPVSSIMLYVRYISGFSRTQTPTPTLLRLHSRNLLLILPVPASASYRSVLGALTGSLPQNKHPINHHRLLTPTPRPASLTLLFGLHAEDSKGLGRL